MKKTLITLLALASCAMGETTTITLTPNNTGNYNSTMHGFYLSLSSDELTNTSSISLPSAAILESLTLAHASNTGANVTYGFVVLSSTSNTVLGISDIQTSKNGTNASFSFSALDGGDLVLNTADTYRYVTVSSGVMDLFTDASKTYIYNGGGTGEATYTTAENTITISQGLTAPGMRFYYSADESVDDCCAIFSSGIASGKGSHSPLVTAVVRPIPEPTTATLSLLALTLLSARRRRK